MKRIGVRFKPPRIRRICVCGRRKENPLQRYCNLCHQGHRKVKVRAHVAAWKRKKAAKRAQD